MNKSLPVFLPQWNEDKLTSLSLPSFNPFVIVLYFLFRRLAKKIAPKINDYYYEDAYGEPGRVAPVAKTNDDNDGPKPYIAYEYVQLFSWSLVASILNCFYKISVKKPNRKDPSKWKIMHQNCEKKVTKILSCLFSSVAKMFDNKGYSFWVFYSTTVTHNSKPGIIFFSA